MDGQVELSEIQKSKSREKLSCQIFKVQMVREIQLENLSVIFQQKSEPTI